MTAVGVAGFAVPLLGSWQPNAKALAAGGPVKVNLAGLEPGSMMIVNWRGRPIFVVSHSEQTLEVLENRTDQLADPDSKLSIQPEDATGFERSKRPGLTVLVGVCTHLGCSPKYLPTVVPQPFDSNWAGGFYCPCHGSMFDLAGRVYKGVPAPTNLEVPNYTLAGDVLTVGA